MSPKVLVIVLERILASHLEHFASDFLGQLGRVSLHICCEIDDHLSRRVTASLTVLAGHGMRNWVRKPGPIPEHSLEGTFPTGLGHFALGMGYVFRLINVQHYASSRHVTCNWHV